MLSGPYLSMVSLYHHFASASWLPWVLLALEGVLRRPGPRPTAWLAVAAAGLALAGSADLCLMTAAACVVRVAFAAASDLRGARGQRTLAALAASCALAALLAAVQWWPTLAHVAVGSRGSMGASNMYWSVHPASLIDALVPGLVAELPLGPAWRAAVFEARGPLLRSLYVGVPALSLAACALASGRWPMRWLAAILAVAFLVAALGRFTPVYPALVGLPLIRLLRYPVKYLVPATLFLSLLSGAGVDALRQEWSGRARRMMWMVVIAAALGAAGFAAAAASSARIAAALYPSLDAGYGGDIPTRLRDGFARVAVLALVSAGMVLVASWRRSPALLALPLALSAADLLMAGRSAIRLGPPELLRQRPPVLEAFPRVADHRVYLRVYGNDWLRQHFTRVPPGWNPEWAWALGHTERLAAPIPTRFGLSGSFDGDFTGLAPLSLSWLTAVVATAPESPVALTLLRMASVTDVVSFEDTMAGLPPRLERWSVYAKPVRVFAVPDPLPRVSVVSGTRVDTRPEELSVVTDPAFDPRLEVALDASSGRAASPPAADTGRAQILDRRSDRMRVAVSARLPAVLLVTESFDPGWRAWVDGLPAPVWRANGIFRGVPVPPGDHVVEMRYRPPAVAWGAAASVLGVAMAGFLIGRRRA
jgi:hypothetical protein